MTDYEFITDLLEQIKTCPDNQVNNYFPAVGNKFRFLQKVEKELLANSFYQWATENSGETQIKLAYSELLYALQHFTIEENEMALQWLVKARKHFDENDDAEGKGLCAVLTGAVYRTFGNFDLALKVLWEAYALLKQSGHYPIFLAATANSIANINLELNEFTEAEEMFKIAFEESTKANDYYFNIYALQGLGKVNLLQKDIDESKIYFEKALLEAEKNKSALQTANSLTELAKYYFSQNDFLEAEKLNKLALEIRELNNFKGGVVTSYIHLGEIYIKLENWDDALLMLNKGLALAEHIRVKPKISMIHFLLSEIYRSKNNFEESLYHFKQYHEVKSEVEKEDSARKLTDAKLIFEAEQTKKENATIKKQKEEIEKKNVELQQTIDELTRTKISRKAKAFTLGLAIVLFIFQDFILGNALRLLNTNDYFIGLVVKMGIIFSLSPINRTIEHYLLKKVMKVKK